MIKLLAVFVGGGFGSIARYSLYLLMGGSFKWFPWYTLLANSLSCLLLGIMIVIFNEHSRWHPAWALLIGVGFCGGFSTFSTFTAELFNYTESNQYGMTLLYIASSVVISFICLFSGIYVAKSFLTGFAE